MLSNDEGADRAKIRGNLGSWSRYWLIMEIQFEALILRKTLRVPLPASASASDGAGGAGAARQLDSALLGAGFKLSGELMQRLSGLPAGDVLKLGARMLAGVRELVGDDVQHNVYFKEFPKGVPDTLEFWISSLRAALLDPVAAENIEAGFVWLPGAGETGAGETGAGETGADETGADETGHPGSGESPRAASLSLAGLTCSACRTTAATSTPTKRCSPRTKNSSRPSPTG